jgi:hypothetical protein
MKTKELFIRQAIGTMTTRIKPATPRHLRRSYVTPRMQQVLDVVASAGAEGIKRTEIEAQLGLAASNLRDLLQALRFLGMADTIGSKKFSRWVVPGKKVKDAEDDATDLPSRQITRKQGEWQAKIKQAQAWHPR